MSLEHSVQRVMSGQARGLGPTVLRAALAVAEPGYRAAVGWRNRGFDRDPARVRRLPRPVVSIGNLTTGGTGKTPVVRWLADALRRRGLAVAILSRGYKAAPGTLGDEQRMLLALLGGASNDGPPVEIEADPDRFAAGHRVLARSPGVDVFLLDDAFQHRRLHRDLDVVLLHAGEPFGYGHLLPRGLLREPTSSLRRAGAVVLTNAEPPADGATAAPPSEADRYAPIVAEVRRWNADCPVVREWHAPAGFRSSVVPSGQPVDQPPTALATRRAFCFSGLGSPQGFEAQVRALAGHYCGEHRFPDHHDYAAADVATVRAAAARAGADVLVTTEKDWVKVAPQLEATTDGDRGTLSDASPIWRLDVAAQFAPGDERELLDRVAKTVSAFRP